MLHNFIYKQTTTIIFLRFRIFQQRYRRYDRRTNQYREPQCDNRGKFPINETITSDRKNINTYMLYIFYNNETFVY